MPTPQELAQQAAKREQDRKDKQEAAKKAAAAKAKPPKAASTKQPDTTPTESVDQNLDGFEFYTRPQYAVLRQALRRSEAKLVGQRRLDDGTLAYVALDAEGVVIRRGTISPTVDFPSKAS